jgi:hypothetical protein
LFVVHLMMAELSVADSSAGPSMMCTLAAFSLARPRWAAVPLGKVKLPAVRMIPTAKGDRRMVGPANRFFE